ncbi:hypothetical protein RSAG8_09618, partial [Rhizoctonia solani AG-8 WAC10335]
MDSRRRGDGYVGRHKSMDTPAPVNLYCWILRVRLLQSLFHRGPQPHCVSFILT